MQRNSRNRISRTRAKLISWSNDRRKRLVLISTLALIIPVAVIFLSFVIKSKILNSQDALAIKSANKVEVYEDIEKVDLGKIEDTKTDIDTSKQVKEPKEPEKVAKTTMTVNILGEIMMGGKVTSNLNYLYASAFKDIYTQVRNADFTYATLGTNITNLTKLDMETLSKYLVTKDFVNATNALGIDSVNIATDHVTDYSDTIFKSTLDILRKGDVHVAGLNNETVYLEKGDKKIGIVAANSVFVGTSAKYIDYGVNVYNQEKIANQISEAKQNADFVIVDIHWGRSTIFGVTEQMKTMAKSAIDAGANLIIGSNALGIYPITTYKGIPIIYSTGYLMTDATEYLAKESGIFEVTISKENRVQNIKMTPVYIKDSKEAIYYQNYNFDFANAYINQLNRWNNENGLNSQIVDQKIVVSF